MEVFIIKQFCKLTPKGQQKQAQTKFYGRTEKRRDGQADRRTDKSLPANPPLNYVVMVISVAS